MNINVKNKMTEMVNEKLEQIEQLELNSLKEQVVDTIVDLVNQANSIEKENSSVEETFVYENVGNPKDLIAEIDKKAGEARTKYKELKQMKQSQFWTIGRNKEKVEKSQEVLGEVIDAIDNNANATKALFNAQTKMAQFSKKLYKIGIMSIAANRMVVREVKLRLENASQTELSQLARQELESVIKELQQQQNIENKIDNNHRETLLKFEETSNAIHNNKEFYIKELNIVKELHGLLKKQVDENNGKALSKLEEINNVIRNNKEAFVKELNIIKEQYSLLEKQVDDNNGKAFSKLEEINNIIHNNKELFVKELDIVKELYNLLEKQVNENNKLLNSRMVNFDKRLELLENTTFFDSSIYKIVLAIAAFGAFILSVLQYLSL